MNVEFPTDDNGPDVEVETTDFGFHYAAIRQSADDSGVRYVRVSPFILPYVQNVPPSLRDDFDTVSLFVPYDDEHVAHYDVRWTRTGAVATAPMFASHGTRFGDTVNSAYHWTAVPVNRWGQDHAAMRPDETFNGFEGVAVQDAAVQVSMGRTLDRTREHLGVADTAIIRFRRLLIESARTVAAGGDPLGLAHPVDTASISSATAILPVNSPWRNLVPAHRALQLELAADGTAG